jgi:hypothetical protein
LEEIIIDVENFVIEDSFEVYIQIEYFWRKTGDAGKKIHTRSWP